MVIDEVPVRAADARGCSAAARAGARPAAAPCEWPERREKRRLVGQVLEEVAAEHDVDAESAATCCRKGGSARTPHRVPGGSTRPRIGARGRRRSRWPQRMWRRNSPKPAPMSITTSPCAARSAGRTRAQHLPRPHPWSSLGLGEEARVVEGVEIERHPDGRVAAVLRVRAHGAVGRLCIRADGNRVLMTAVRASSAPSSPSTSCAPAAPSRVARQPRPAGPSARRARTTCRADAELHIGDVRDVDAVAAALDGGRRRRALRRGGRRGAVDVPGPALRRRQRERHGDAAAGAHRAARRRSPSWSSRPR